MPKINPALAKIIAKREAAAREARRQEAQKRNEERSAYLLDPNTPDVEITLDEEDLLDFPVARHRNDVPGLLEGLVQDLSHLSDPE